MVSGTNAAYLPTPLDAMRGTEAAYGGTRDSTPPRYGTHSQWYSSAVLATRMILGQRVLACELHVTLPLAGRLHGDRSQVPGTSLRASYAVSGTGLQQCLRPPYAIPGTDISHLPMTEGMCPRTCYAMLCTDVG
eukprot:496938-Rhodomonas_salina.1